jgi:drug/metabolite transporter (DMT)-like permease
MEQQGEVQKGNLRTGVVLILLSAFMTSIGQLLWKLSDGSSLLLILSGFALYGLGAVTMTISFRFGEMSVLHPMLGASLVLSIVYGSIFLNEQITTGKLVGAMLIILGLICLGISGKRGEQAL